MKHNWAGIFSWMLDVISFESELQTKQMMNFERIVKQFIR